MADQTISGAQAADVITSIEKTTINNVKSLVDAFTNSMQQLIDNMDLPQSFVSNSRNIATSMTSMVNMQRMNLENAVAQYNPPVVANTSTANTAG